MEKKEFYRSRRPYTLTLIHQLTIETRQPKTVTVLTLISPGYTAPVTDVYLENGVLNYTKEAGKFKVRFDF